MNKKIAALKKERNSIYSKITKLDDKIGKEELLECEEEKEKYVGKYFKRDSYADFPEYIRITSYVKNKGFRMICVDVDNSTFESWVSTYTTYHLQSGLTECSKKLFETKLNKALSRLR